MAADGAAPEAAGADGQTRWSLRGRLRELYFGGDLRATRFQLALLCFDLLTVTFFLATTFLPTTGWLLGVDLLIATGLGLELASRLYVSPRPLQYLRQPM